MAAGQASVKLDVSVAAVIGLLKVALTTALVAMPVNAGELAAGDVDETIGCVPTLGAPRIGSVLPPQAASNKVTSAATQPRGEREVWNT